MRTLSIQQIPNGFELEPPSSSYWFKAGLAFSAGAAVVYVALSIAWLFLLGHSNELLLLRSLHIV
jgi:hypothetical protein